MCVLSAGNGFLEVGRRLRRSGWAAAPASSVDITAGGPTGVHKLSRHTPRSPLFVRFFGVFFFCRSPCCVVSSVLSPKQQRFCLFAPPLVGLSVMNKGTDFYVSRLRVCCSMVLSFTLPRSAAFRVFCIASSLYSSLADFCSGERRLFLSLRRRNHLVSDVDRRETGLFPRKTKTSLPGCFFFFLKKNGEPFQLGEADVCQSTGDSTGGRAHSPTAVTIRGLVYEWLDPRHALELQEARQVLEGAPQP